MELGRILREKRESLGLTVEDIEDKTKIRRRYVEALENGDWTVLPGRVYARGFVRSYAEVIGLDGVELLQRYVDGQEIPGMHGDHETGQFDDATIRVKRVDSSAVSDAAGPVRKPAAKMVEPRSLNEFQRQRAAEKVDRTERVERQTEAKAPTQSRTERIGTDTPRRSLNASRGSRHVGGFVGQMAMIVGALVVIGGAYMYLHDRHRTSGAATQNTTPVAGSGVNATNAASANSSAANNTANQVANGASNNSNGNSAAGNQTGSGNTANQTSQAPPVTVTAEPFANGKYTYDVKNVKNLQVQLKVVSGQCWISVYSDGSGVDPNDILNPGETKTFTANQAVTMTLGHVQGVQLIVNGQPVPLPVTGSAPTIVIQKQG